MVLLIWSADFDGNLIHKIIYTGWGTDEMAMIDVLAHRNAAQRKQIKIVYEEQYEEKLLKRIESEISGHFEV